MDFFLPNDSNLCQVDKKQASIGCDLKKNYTFQITRPRDLPIFEVISIVTTF